MSGGLQYLRCCRITLGGSAGTAVIEYDGTRPEPMYGEGGPGLKITFRVTHAEKPTPQNLVLAIYNLADPTAQKFVKKEWTEIKLECGYEGQYQIVFKGEIIQGRLTTERMTDRVTLVLAKDSGRGIEHSTVSQSLPRGHTYRDQIDACLKAWQPFGITAGQISDFSQTKPLRPRVLHGMVSSALNGICQTLNASWHVRGGKLYVLKNTETLDGVIVLTSQSGMIGRAEQTISGIVVTSFLNPRIRPKTKLKIDERSINRGAYSPDHLAQNETTYPNIAADGLYEVLDVDEVGDTRGQDWYTIAYCLAANKPFIPVGLAPRGIGVLSNSAGSAPGSGSGSSGATGTVEIGPITTNRD